jgi:hypothetical protein
MRPSFEFFLQFVVMNFHPLCVFGVMAPLRLRSLPFFWRFWIKNFSGAARKSGEKQPSKPLTAEDAFDR